jgi:hypothetical protein
MITNTAPNGIVLLYSYRRPNLTQDAINRLLEWNNLEKLYISVDGLQIGSSSEERMWRLETISVSAEARKNSSKIELLIWEENTGLTDHANRALKHVFATHSKVISLEEDNLISVDGLEFLNDIETLCGAPHIKASFSKHRHLDEPLGKKYSIFPEQWGTSLNKVMFAQYLSIQETKIINPEMIKKRLSLILGESNTTQRVTNRWIRIFEESMLSQNFGDGLMQYAALSAGAFYEVPWHSYTEDLGHLDSRGIHSRSKSNSNLGHKSEIMDLNGFRICLKCEKLNSGWLEEKFARRIRSLIIATLYKNKTARKIIKKLLKK